MSAGKAFVHRALRCAIGSEHEPLLILVPDAILALALNPAMFAVSAGLVERPRAREESHPRLGIVCVGHTVQFGHVVHHHDRPVGLAARVRAMLILIASTSLAVAAAAKTSAASYCARRSGLTRPRPGGVGRERSRTTSVIYRSAPSQPDLQRAQARARAPT